MNDDDEHEFKELALYKSNERKQHSQPRQANPSRQRTLHGKEDAGVHGIYAETPRRS